MGVSEADTTHPSAPPAWAGGLACRLGGVPAGAVALVLTACGGGTTTAPGSRVDASVVDATDDGAGSEVGSAADGGPMVQASPIVISTAAMRPRTTTWSVNYWQWSPTYGDYIPGTEAQIQAVAPAVLRVGGYNNDANTPDPFDHAQLDTAIAYARAIGAEPLLQVPHLADVDGGAPTPATGAEMVTYANITQGYAVKYFSVGNEPDLYAAQGLPSDATQPAIVGYTPSAYCSSVRAYVDAMKAVDPSIQIVGPDLAYQYQAGSDWLTPILQGCGDVFDIVSIHRYPFSSAQALVSSAAADAVKFRSVIASVRGLMQVAGYGNKPLALMEMNVAYDATPPDGGAAASPGTVPSALWLADGLGSAIDIGLWTSAVWNISDTPDWSLGIIGPPAAHAPRPQYYAYLLYADHFGPTVVDVTQAPAGVAAHASRNQTDTATEVVALNWNASPAPVAFQVTGLPSSVTAPIYVLPSLSMTAVEIPDVGGGSSASTYGDPQYLASIGPVPLAAGVGVVVSDAGSGGPSEAGPPPFVCPSVTLPTSSVTTAGTASGAALAFGAAGDTWGTYTYGGPGQPTPTATLTSDGNGFQVVAALVSPDGSNDFAGMGLYYSAASCADVSSYTGVTFDLSGDLGACSLVLGAQSSADLSAADDPNRGTCAASAAACYGGTLPIVVDDGPVHVPFSGLTGGMPADGVDPRTLVTLYWQVSATLGSEDGGGCSATFTVENLAFY
jgi:hypothetical protein